MSPPPPLHPLLHSLHTLPLLQPTSQIQTLYNAIDTIQSHPKSAQLIAHNIPALTLSNEIFNECMQLLQGPGRARAVAREKLEGGKRINCSMIVDGGMDGREGKEGRNGKEEKEGKEGKDGKEEKMGRKEEKMEIKEMRMQELESLETGEIIEPIRNEIAGRSDGKRKRTLPNDEVHEAKRKRSDRELRDKRGRDAHIDVDDPIKRRRITSATTEGDELEYDFDITHTNQMQSPAQDNNILDDIQDIVQSKYHLHLKLFGQLLVSSHFLYSIA